MLLIKIEQWMAMSIEGLGNGGGGGEVYQKIYEIDAGS